MIVLSSVECLLVRTTGLMMSVVVVVAAAAALDGQVGLPTCHPNHRETCCVIKCCCCCSPSTLLEMVSLLSYIMNNND